MERQGQVLAGGVGEERGAERGADEEGPDQLLLLLAYCCHSAAGELA